MLCYINEQIFTQWCRDLMSFDYVVFKRVVLKQNIAVLETIVVIS